MQSAGRSRPKPAPAHRLRGIVQPLAWSRRHRPKPAAPAPLQRATRQRPPVLGLPGQAPCTRSPVKRSSARNPNRWTPRRRTPKRACRVSAQSWRSYDLSSCFRSSARTEVRAASRSSPLLLQATQSSPAATAPAPKCRLGSHEGSPRRPAISAVALRAAGPKPHARQTVRRTLRRRPGPVGLRAPAPKRLCAGPGGPTRQSLDLGMLPRASTWAETHGQPLASPPNLWATRPVTRCGSPGAEAPRAPRQPRAASIARLRQLIDVPAPGRSLHAGRRRAARPSGDTPTYRLARSPVPKHRGVTLDGAHHASHGPR